MRSDAQVSRIGVVSRLIGIASLAALLFVVGCAGGGATLTVTTTSAQLATVIIHAVYPSTTLTAANGTAPYSWAITSGALPASEKPGRSTRSGFSHLAARAE